jgi:mevalonate kinase
LVLHRSRTHGKWILAGEHTVLRGGQALVFPVESRYLDFSFEPGDELRLNIQHQNTDLEMAFWGVLEKALQKLGLSRKQVSGQLSLKSNIPVGAGMGASATLCVSLAKWLTSLGHLAETEQYDFAKDLENLFHGQSSGVDVAVALRHEPLIFSVEGGFEPLTTNWKPHFYLSYCGKRGVTADCIRRVQDLIEQNPRLGDKLDRQMKQSVGLARKL